MSTKSAQLQIRVTPKEKAALRRRAAAAGLDVSTYVLACALSQRDERFATLVDALGSAAEPSFVLAELNALLTECAPIEFQETVANAPIHALSPWAANYVAAMVEMAAHLKGVRSPKWVRAVSPLEAPWFATTLRSLRPYLLRVSPVPFKRRNLFVDSAVGAQV